MLSKNSVIVFALILSIVSCKQHEQGKFRVYGTYKNASVTKVLLMGIPTGKDQTPLILDSTKLTGSSGEFSLTGRGKGQEIYEIVFGDNIPVPVISDADEIKLDVDLGKRDDYYQVSGSPASLKLKELINSFSRLNFKVEKAFATIDSCKKANAPDSAQIAATNAKNNSVDELNGYLKKFIQDNTNPSLCILALGWGARSFSSDDFEHQLDVLTKRYPGNVVVQNMKTSYYAQKNQAPETSNSWVGKTIPDLELPDASGKQIALASFKGKYVLVDFWASWCGPCRMENPNVVTAYDEFKTKNFTILGVSLDKDKDAWQQAVKDDKLAWAQVSDLKYWNSKAVQVFGFQGIPFNILVDPQGKIIAEELRGPALTAKLKEVLQ